MGEEREKQKPSLNEKQVPTNTIHNPSFTLHLLTSLVGATTEKTHPPNHTIFTRHFVLDINLTEHDPVKPNNKLSYRRDNSVIPPKSPHCRRGLRPRCWIGESRRCSRCQRLVCSTIKTPRDLSSDRREPGRLLSTHFALLSTKGQGYGMNAEDMGNNPENESPNFFRDWINILEG